MVAVHSDGYSFEMEYVEVHKESRCISSWNLASSNTCISMQADELFDIIAVISESAEEQYQQH